MSTNKRKGKIKDKLPFHNLSSLLEDEKQVAQTHKAWSYPRQALMIKEDCAPFDVTVWSKHRLNRSQVAYRSQHTMWNAKPLSGLKAGTFLCPINYEVPLIGQNISGFCRLLSALRMWYKCTCGAQLTRAHTYSTWKWTRGQAHMHAHTRVQRRNNEWVW